MADDAAWRSERWNTWKSNVPFLYDYFLLHKLEWPSLAVNWRTTTSLPAASTKRNEHYERRSFLYAQRTRPGKRLCFCSIRWLHFG